MKIKTKLESYNKIKELDLNRLPEEIFTEKQLDSVKDFLDMYPAEYYAIRDKSKAGGVFKLAVKKQDIWDEIKGYKLFSINVSSINYSKNQLLVGEIMIGKDAVVWAILSKNPNYSVRDAIRKPDYNLSTNLFDKTLDEIPGFNQIYEYIVKNKLMNTIVEFAYFDIPVGVNNENIVVYEVRTDY